MKRRIILQTQPDHWAPDYKFHYPNRCILCVTQRIGLWLGVIEFEEE